MRLLNPVGKGRKPKFELQLKIYDLNNVPLVSGTSHIKWHLTHSMHAEHRGRTPKCAVANHRVEYGFSKHVPQIRISVDKNNNLVECPIEFEIIQEFAVTEKITLGVLRLNLSEYVEESEAFIKESISSPGRHRAGSNDVSPTAVPKVPKQHPGEKDEKDDVSEGIVRRYLMQESKVNSTLKISILMAQVDGDRNFVAPPLRSAPTFDGIAGVVTHEQQAEDEAAGCQSIYKLRDTTEIHDLYCRTLAASWNRLPGEPPADECIEDIFAGGNGWGAANDHGNADTTDEDDQKDKGTLRPSDFRRKGHQQNRSHHGGQHHNHKRSPSATSDKSAATVTGRLGTSSGKSTRQGRDSGVDSEDLSTSLASSGLTKVGGRSEGVGRSAQEVDESDVREDMVAWKLPS